ncbi:dethiobiotin synthase [Maribacter algicola]|uniref:Dethiobiotin synthase n=1 Tax=Meishania litoralis TaxID=3434685 RepID=A0ACC7LJA7_9FLAO
MKRFFVTGISTEVGKTVTAAIIAEALEADYWKPIQAGDLDKSDSHTVKKLVSSKKTVIHKSSYELKSAMSPHAAAKIDNITIELDKLREPETENHLVIEGSGGLLVPLNDHDTIMDIIMPNYKVIVVSRHYLGSINHTLLTIESLQQRGYEIAILFNGKENVMTESIITKKAGAPVLGRIDEETKIDKEVVKKYANVFRPVLLSL